MNAGRLGRILAAVLFLAMAAPMCRAQSANGADSAAIRDLVAELESAFNQHNATSWAALYAEDGDFTNIRGVAAHGRKNIEAFMTPLFSGILKNATGNDMVRGIRMLTPTLAEVDVDTTATINPSAPPAKGLTNMVLSKQSGHWMILIFHEQDFPPPRPPAGN